MHFSSLCSFDYRWTRQLEQVKTINNRGKNSKGAPIVKPRSKKLHKSKSFNRSSATADTASVISVTSTSSKKSSRESSDNPWIAPTFLSNEIELPKDLSCNVLKSGRNILEESKDPFRMLGPVKYFNARKQWDKPYTVQLIRDDKVVYGFSIQGED